MSNKSLVVINASIEIDSFIRDEYAKEQVAIAKIRKLLPNTTAICDQITIFSWDEPSEGYPTYMAYADYGVKIKIPSVFEDDVARYMKSIYPELNNNIVNDIWVDDSYEE